MHATSSNQYEARTSRRVPDIEQVADGLWAIPVPLPNNPLLYVIVYALETSQGPVLVDAGWNDEVSWNVLTNGLARLGTGPREVAGILITHLHPDHLGLAERVREVSGAWVAMHPEDAKCLPADEVAANGIVDAYQELLELAGAPPDAADALFGAGMATMLLESSARPDILLNDGDIAPVSGWELRVLWTPGHSPGHVCFVEEERRFILGGDHLLPKVSPNVSLHPQQSANPLADFLWSLSRVLSEVGDPATVQVLPAHDYRYRGLADRVAELIGHHDERLGELITEITASGPSTAWELASQVHWSRPWAEFHVYQRRMAMGETLAHLVLLEHRGRVRREPGLPARWALA